MVISFMWIILLGCGTKTDFDPDRYAFPSRLDPEVDAVAYDGQVMRRLLIAELVAHVRDLPSRIEGGFAPEPGEVEAELGFFFDFDGSIAGEAPLRLDLDLPLVQSRYDDIATGKDLAGKIAGREPETDHADWSTAFIGPASSPEALVRSWFAELDAQAVAAAGGENLRVGLTADGRDLAVLLESFLHVAVGFSQAADDYLDDDVPGKGLLADHETLVEGEPYTALEHGWDEAFGYFGASRAYGAWGDGDAATGFRDDDGDGRIDLATEWCSGLAGWVAEIDVGTGDRPDRSDAIWSAFHGGRALLAQTEGPLSEREMDELREYRDAAVGAQEEALAAIVLKALDKTIEEEMVRGGAGWRLDEHAAAWSRAKGLALGFQFNPRSAMGREELVALHALLGDSPALEAPDAGRLDALLQAVDLLEAVYGGGR